MLKYGLPILAAVVLALAAYSMSNSRPAQASAPPPSPPPTTSFPRSVGAVGLVEASTENIAVSVPVSGLVTRVMVEAGDAVKKGQPLFTLDDRDLSAEQKLRDTAVDLARAKLERLRQSPRAEDIPPAEARVREAEQALADVQVQLRLIESVRDRRAIREEDLLRRGVAVKSAEARLAEAQANLTLLKAGAWAPDIRIAEAELAQAESQVRRVQADRERLTVRASVSGTVLQCKVRAGEYAQAGPLVQPLMLLGATERLHLRADVDERDAWRVRPGAKAKGSVRGNSALTYPLEFVRMEPYVVPKRNLTGDSTERVDTRVLQVIYALSKDAPVYPGQQMDVYIEETGGKQ